ncbi:hypothetical protein ACPF8X_40900, partial [Streptomyces sp. G35A]
VGNATDEELTSYLFTGHNSVDKEIRTWLAYIDANMLREVWNDYFATSSTVTVSYDTIDYSRSIAKSLILYLFCRKLSTTPASIEGMTPLVYNTKLTNIEYYAGAVVCSRLRELELACRTDRLVLAAAPTAKSIQVCGTVYDKYLEEGGSVEVILGLLTGGIPASSLEGVKQSSAKAMDAWNRYVSLVNYNNKKGRAEILRGIYSSEFVNQLSDISELEKEYHQAHPGYADVSLKHTKDYLGGLTEDQLEDFASNALYIIAKLRFGYTQAYQILCDIEAAMKANPNLDPREAATIATINLVSDYVSAQLQRI